MDNNVGTIIINTKVDNSGLQKGLKETQTIAKQTDEKITSDIKQNLYNKSNEEAKFLERHYKYLKDMEKRFAERKLVSRKLSGEIDQQYFTYKDDSVVNYTSKITELEAKLQQLLSTYNIMSRMKGFDEQSKEAQNLQDEIEKTATELEKLKQKQEELNQSGFEGINFELQGIGEKVSGVIRKIGRWAIALFGIRTAFSFIRQSMSLLNNDENRIETKINNIKMVLVASLEPVILNIINLIVKMLSYLNYITKSWWGIDLFANAAELASRKMKDNVEGAAGAAEDMRKSLAGFDEMNIIGDNVSAGSGVGGGGAGLDPNEFIIEEQPVAEWFKKLADWVKENKELILGAIAAIGTAIAGLKLMKLLSDVGFSLDNILTVLGLIAAIYIGYETYKVLDSFFKMIEADAKIASGECKTLYEELEALEEKASSEETFYETTSNIIDIISVLPVPFKEVLSWMSKVYDKAGDIAKDDADELKAMRIRAKIEDVETALKNLKEAQDNLENAHKNYERAVDGQKTALENLIRVQDDTGISGEELYNSVRNGDRDYSNLNDTEKEVYKAYETYVDKEKELKTAIENKNKEVDNEKIKNWEKMAADAKVRADMEKTDKAYEDYRDAVLDAYEKGELKSDEAALLIEKANANISADSRKTFKKDIPDAIKDAFVIPDDKIDALNNRINSIGDDLPAIMGQKMGEAARKMQNALGNLRIPVMNGPNISWKYINEMKKGGIVSIPRLATGAIINQPGRGVPVGNSAIAGEAGREGVIPLTDNQAMEMLGRAIGRYVNINATIPVKLGDRQIAREMRNIMAESDFAFNR